MAKRKAKSESAEITDEKVIETTERDKKKARALVDKARAEHGDKVLLNIKPLAFRAELREGFDPSDERTLFAPSVEIRPVVNPLLDATLLLFGFERSGAHSYRIGVGKDSNPRFISAMFKTIPETSFCADKSRIDRAHKRGLRADFNTNLAHEAKKLLEGTPLAEKLSDSNELRKAISNSGQHFNSYYEWEQWREAAGVFLSSSKTQLYIRLVTCGPHTRSDGTGGQLLTWPDSPNFNTLSRDGAREPVKLSPAEAIAALRVMRELDFPILVGDGIADLKRSLGDKVMALPVPGAPGLGRLLVPEAKGKAVADHGLDLAPLAPVDDEGNYRTASEYLTYEASADEIENLRGKLRGLTVMSDPRLDDVIRMAAAKPNGKRAPLREYQDAAAALHTTTQFGYVNASSPGLGKTVMILQGMRERAAAKSGS